VLAAALRAQATCVITTAGRQRAAALVAAALRAWSLASSQLLAAALTTLRCVWRCVLGRCVLGRWRHRSCSLLRSLLCAACGTACWVATCLVAGVVAVARCCAHCWAVRLVARGVSAARRCSLWARLLLCCVLERFASSPLLGVGFLLCCVRERSCRRCCSQLCCVSGRSCRLCCLTSAQRCTVCSSASHPRHCLTWARCCAACANAHTVLAARGLRCVLRRFHRRCCSMGAQSLLRCVRGARHDSAARQ
jgi:hypothetical protein